MLDDPHKFPKELSYECFEPLTTRYILYADDNKVMRDAEIRGLKKYANDKHGNKYDLKFIPLSNGKTAWEILESMTPEQKKRTVLITDDVMAGLSGRELIKDLRCSDAIAKYMPIIFLPGYMGEDDALDMKRHMVHPIAKYSSDMKSNLREALDLSLEKINSLYFDYNADARQGEINAIKWNEELLKAQRAWEVSSERVRSIREAIEKEEAKKTAEDRRKEAYGSKEHDTYIPDDSEYLWQHQLPSGSGARYARMLRMREHKDAPPER